MKNRFGLVRTGTFKETFGKLHTKDVQKCLNRLPEEVYDLLQEYPNELVLAGGFIRALVAGERPRDIDLFIGHKGKAEQISSNFYLDEVSVSKNAYSISKKTDIKIQVCFLWEFSSPEELLDTFDFSICKAAIFYDGHEFSSCVSSFFYPDINNKTLRPQLKQRREVEDFNRTIVRSTKFYEMGYKPTHEMYDLAHS